MLLAIVLGRPDATHRPLHRRCSALLTAMLVAGCSAASAPPPAAAATAEEAAITRLLATNPGWRVAEVRDNGDSAGVRRQREREPDYAPYRRRGDWNGDGVADLAVVLVRDSVFRAVWLPGSPDGFGPAETLGETPELRAGGLFELDGALVIGPFESDAVWVWRWNAATGRLELADDDA